MMAFYRSPIGENWPRVPLDRCSRCGLPAMEHSRDQQRDKLVCPDDAEARGTIVGTPREFRELLEQLTPNAATLSPPVDVPQKIRERMRALRDEATEILQAGSDVGDLMVIDREIQQLDELIARGIRQRLSGLQIDALEERRRRLFSARGRLLKDRSEPAEPWTTGTGVMIAGRRSGKSSAQQQAARKPKNKTQPASTPAGAPRRYYDED